jgi:probable HAF family extracellular repeat protein
MCGYGTPADGPVEIGMVWDRAGGLRQIGMLPGGTSAIPECINNLGQVAGTGNTDVGQDPWDPSPVRQHAFLWDDDLGTVDLGTLGCGDDVMWVTGINDTGQVVGTSISSEDENTSWYHAFLWAPGVGMRDLGALPGDEDAEAYGINNSGQVIGVSRGRGDERGFVWDAVNGMQDIADLVPPETGWSDFCPGDINDSGQIVGWRPVSYGPTAGWVYRAVLLTPIPECSTAGIVAWGLVALRGRRRRRWHHP